VPDERRKWPNHSRVGLPEPAPESVEKRVRIRGWNNQGNTHEPLQYWFPGSGPNPRRNRGTRSSAIIQTRRPCKVLIQCDNRCHYQSLPNVRARSCWVRLTVHNVDHGIKFFRPISSNFPAFRCILLESTPTDCSPSS
jgi:hypothetical protein